MDNFRVYETGITQLDVKQQINAGVMNHKMDGDSFYKLDGSASKQSDHEFWNKKQKGLDFNENSSELSNLSHSMKQHDELNQYELMRCSGLDEILDEKLSTESLLNVNISTAEEEKEASRIIKEFNLFEVAIKDAKYTGKLSASQAIKRILLGLDYNLDQFKSKEEKIDLLKSAVQIHDGNTILTVVLFLRNTLKKVLFQKEIMNFTDAVNIYLSYLQEDHETDELDNMLLLLRKAEEAALFKYDEANLICDPTRKFKVLGNLLNTYSQLGTVSEFINESVLEHIMVLEDQKSLVDALRNLPGKIIPTNFCIVTHKKKIMDSSAIHTVIFSISHLNSISGFQKSKVCPDALKKHFQISEKLYLWCNLRTLAASKQFQELDNFFLVKKWLGGQKFQTSIGFQNVLSILSKNEAPHCVMEKYINCLQDEEEKLFFAKKYKCHSIVMEIFKKRRDRQALVNYKPNLLPHSLDYCNLISIINEDLKWRN